VAVAVETDAEGDIHPAVYLRTGGSVEEHLLAGDPLLRFDGEDHRSQLESIMKEWLP
jgi:hypothetical protein